MLVASGTATVGAAGTAVTPGAAGAAAGGSESHRTGRWRKAVGSTPGAEFTTHRGLYVATTGRGLTDEEVV